MSDELERLRAAAKAADQGEGISLAGMSREDRRDQLRRVKEVGQQEGMMDDEVTELVAELRRTRKQRAAYRELVTKDGGRATRSNEIDVPVHGEIALRAADMIEKLAKP